MYILKVYLTVFVFFVLLSGNFFSNQFIKNVEGKSFKEQSGITLDNQRVMLPDYFNQRMTLVAYGFSRKSSADFESVLNPFKLRYKNVDEVFYMEIPMIGPSFKLARKFIEKGMRKSIDKQHHAHLMTYFKSTKPFKDYYGVLDKNRGYFFLVDPNGIILWQLAGSATPDNLTSLFDLIDNYLTKVKPENKLREFINEDA
mgnify:CR=1 FL=1